MLSAITITLLLVLLPRPAFLPSNSKVRDIVPIYYKSQEKQNAIFYDPLIAMDYISKKTNFI